MPTEDRPAVSVYDVTGRVHFLSAALLVAVFDGLFLTAWAAAQFLLDRVVLSRVALSGVEGSVLWTFKLVFALATLLPVLFYVAFDILTLFARLRRRYQDDAT